MATSTATGGGLDRLVASAFKMRSRLSWQINPLNSPVQGLFCAQHMSRRSLTCPTRDSIPVTLFQVLYFEMWSGRSLRCRWFWKHPTSTWLPQLRLLIAAISRVVTYARLCPGISSSCRKPESPSPVFSTSCLVCGWGSRRTQWTFMFSTGANTRVALHAIPEIIEPRFCSRNWNTIKSSG